MTRAEHRSTVVALVVDAHPRWRARPLSWCGDSDSVLRRDAPRSRAAIDDRIERLTEADIPAMLALATLAKPGPFAPRTPRLGELWGVWDSKRLVAMAGERMRHDGFTEVSGVCTHPDARGRGLARALSRVVAGRIIDRGEAPYLHAYASNTGAIGLYESLGFRLRRMMHVASIRRTAVGESSGQ